MTPITINTTIDPKSLSFLPKRTLLQWQNKDVKILVTSEFITIQKDNPAKKTLSEVRDKLKGIEKEITQKDIKDAIKWARNQK